MGAEPVLHLDVEPERAGEEWGTAGRYVRVVQAFEKMLVSAVGSPGGESEWLLFVEDDVEFHPRLGSLVRSWEALRDESCVLASLFNPQLRPQPCGRELPRAFAASSKSFLGAQALLIRRSAARRVYRDFHLYWGMQAQRVGAALGAHGPIWVHQPSLVQHVGVDSSWGAWMQTAADFDPAWQG